MAPDDGPRVPTAPEGADQRKEVTGRSTPAPGPVPATCRRRTPASTPVSDGETPWPAGSLFAAPESSVDALFAGDATLPASTPAERAAAGAIAETEAAAQVVARDLAADPDLDPADEAADHADPDALLPVRMLNEYAYCPRLFHLMHVEGRWDDNVHTLDGKQVHRRVDQLDHVLPDATAPPPAADSPASNEPGGSAAEPPGAAAPAGDEPPTVTKCVSLASTTLGLTGKLDLVSTAGDEAVPVERKRGSVPATPERCYEPERIQLMAQGLLLRAHGYQCDHGIIYFAASRTRVTVPFTEYLEGLTLTRLTAARQAARRTTAPPPLEDSPKCNGCSLAAICLPDETLTIFALAAAERTAAQVPASTTAATPVGDAPSGTNPTDSTDPAASSSPPAPQSAIPVQVRRFYPVRDDALPLYVHTQGAQVGKSGQRLIVRFEGKQLAAAPLKDISQLVLCGNIGITAQTTHLLCEAAIPIIHLSMGHWFYGITTGITIRNAYARAAQYAAAGDPLRRLTLARAIVAAKGANQRTLLRRNAQPRPDAALDALARQLDQLPQATTRDELLGHEGALAATYFRAFPALLKNPAFTAAAPFTDRNRRPPKDPINALLSFTYAMLAKDCTVALLAEGLDPWWGMYHEPRHGRPAFALDLMEEFRPLIADSAVLTAINTGMVGPQQFTRSAAGCVMQPAARKAILQAYEARLDQLITHPIFDYRCSWRAIIRLQARLLARWCTGDLPAYTGFTTR